MFHEILNAITDLPVIIQGALGSGLFAFSLWGGQIAYRKTASLVADSNKKRRISYLTDEMVKLNLFKIDNVTEKGAFVTLLIYRASRNFARAFIWLTLGLTFSSFINSFGIVGYLGALYYFFSSLNILRGLEEPDDVPAKLEEIMSELNRLKG